MTVSALVGLVVGALIPLVAKAVVDGPVAEHRRSGIFGWLLHQRERVPRKNRSLFILGLKSRQNKSAFTHLAVAPTYLYLELIFMVRLWFVEP